MAASWRSLPLLTTNGHQQMAIDRWLLDQHIQGNIPSILRFYTWEPIALSLGYHQRQIPDHWQNLTWQGQAIDLIPRPTGGRGVLHQGDLTYAIITSGLSPNRRDSYQQICEFLIQGFRTLNLHLTYGTAGRGYIHNPNCFGTATAADLILPDGSKLIGSAQLHKDGAILQHGSIRLTPDQALFDLVFGTPQRLPHLNLTPDQVIPALTQAAQQCFGGDWYSAPLSLPNQPQLCQIIADQLQSS
jgi:lipoate---protein ligase